MKRYNWRVFHDLRRVWRFTAPGMLPYLPWGSIPRPTYCARCTAWTWCTAEVPALSTKRAFICEECADINDEECDAAWASLCGGNY